MPDLTRFGFTPTEGLVYQVLLTGGPGTGYAIARAAGLARANAYSALEGLVAKGAATRYVPGRASSWLKWKARTTEEVIVGAVTGTVERAQAVIAGRLTPDGQLIVVGRSAVLTAAQADQLASVLAPVDPARHPCLEVGDVAGVGPAAQAAQELGQALGPTPVDR